MILTPLQAKAASSVEFLLSRNGCGRATGYAETNKIITHRDKTHVAWLDSEEGHGFLVRARTLDRKSGTWSDTVTIGGAVDNHGGPALTVDGNGYLHIVYGPHHHPMRYRRSSKPNDITEWEEETEFGEKLTYPTLVCDPGNNLIFTCRRSHSDRPWEMEMWTKPVAGSWQRERILARSRHLKYSHFQEGLTWGPDGKTLHLFFRFHELTDSKGYGRIQNIAYLKSPDRGITWQRLDGTPVKLPATAETADILATGGKDVNRDLRIGGIGIREGDGLPVTYYSVVDENRGDCFLAQPQPDGGWNTINLRPFVPEEFSSWNLITPGGLYLDGDRSLTLVAQIYLPDPPNRSAWGHPRSELCLLRSTDGGHSFDFDLMTGPNPEIPSWLPNVERPTGFNSVPDQPGMIYTRGGKGDKNTDVLSNEVVWRSLA